MSQAPAIPEGALPSRHYPDEVVEDLVPAVQAASSPEKLRDLMLTCVAFVFGPRNDGG